MKKISQNAVRLRDEHRLSVPIDNCVKGIDFHYQ